MCDAIAYYLYCTSYYYSLGCHCYMLYHICHPSKMKDTNIIV